MPAGRKYRLGLTAEQAEMAEGFGGICRAVWNTALEQRREYRRRGAWMGYVAQAAELADAKREHEWLRAAPSHILQQTLKDLDRACRTHGTFKIQWRCKNRWSPSFRFPAGNLITVERLGRKWGRAKLPKLGWVAFRWSRPLGGEIRSATIARKTVAAMNRIMGRVTDRRADFCAFTANRITARNALVVLEDLKTKNMTASASGTVADPGENVTQKRGLNRSILDKGWHRLELALTSAARYTGTVVVKVDPAYTSRTCNVCRVMDSQSRKSQAVFECTACGYQAHADVNAAKNILNAGGWPVSACGDLAAGRSAKQEPPEGREATPDQPSPAGIPRP